MDRDNYFEVTAKGTGFFPLDMLRFGRMFPKDIESVAAMEPLQATDSAFKRKAEREATFCIMGSYMQAHAVKTRFDSFGWTAEITLEDRV